MIMAEKDMRKLLCCKLRKLDAIAVESSARPGTPDINFIGGWIECKWLRQWPKRAKTPVTLDHPLLTGQKVWIRRRNRRGGNAWVMLQCHREWLLFKGLAACNILGTSTREELYDYAYHIWSTGLNVEELIAFIGVKGARLRNDVEEREAKWRALGGSW